MKKLFKDVIHINHQYMGKILVPLTAEIPEKLNDIINIEYRITIKPSHVDMPLNIHYDLFATGILIRSINGYLVQEIPNTTNIGVTHFLDGSMLVLVPLISCTKHNYCSG